MSSVQSKFLGKSCARHDAAAGEGESGRQVLFRAAVHMGEVGALISGKLAYASKALVVTKKFAYVGPIGNSVRDVPPRPGRNPRIWKY
jgi:hypothetical protein